MGYWIPRVNEPEYRRPAHGNEPAPGPCFQRLSGLIFRYFEREKLDLSLTLHEDRDG